MKQPLAPRSAKIGSQWLGAVLSPLQQREKTNLARVSINGCQATGIRRRPTPDDPVHGPHGTSGLVHNPSLKTKDWLRLNAQPLIED